MKTTTVIATVNTDALRQLSTNELKTHTKEAAIEFARSSETGCKWLGVCRQQLVNLGETSEATFKLVASSLEKGGMDGKRAKSATNNANGHMQLAHFLLREDAVTIDEPRFFAVSVRDAKSVASTLSRGGDEAVRKFNKLPLRKGKISRKGLDTFLPAKESPAKEEEVAAATPAESEAEATPATPVEVVAAAIKMLRKELPKLSTKDRDVAISALAKLIG
jgi:hypothetical protein